MKHLLVTKVISGSCIAVLLCLFFSCNKFIEVNTPPTSISEDNIYNNDITAASVLTGIYTKIATTNTFAAGSVTSLSYFPGLSSDELTLYNGATVQSLIGCYKNSLNVLQAENINFWNIFYNIIYTTNATIEGIGRSNQLSVVTSQQLLGEAKFMRAFSYFYLINLYGNVPLVLTTDYRVNATARKVAVDTVYQQVVQDLKDAQQLLSENYLDGSLLKVSPDRVRPTKGAATALLARVFLYTGNYAGAETEATKVIDNRNVYDTVALAGVFKKNSKETIWAIQPVLGTTSQNTGEGRLFIIPSTGFSGSNPVFLSDTVMNRFEAGDQRKAVWTKVATLTSGNYNYAFKYTIGKQNVATQEYIMVLRLAEQYLIRAEARARLGKVTAADDLNVLRKRARISNTTASGTPALLVAIGRERQVELFTEWGDRWFNLKRTGEVDAVMGLVTPNKGGTWDHKWTLYPIPQLEIDRNINVKQNLGY